MAEKVETRRRSRLLGDGQGGTFRRRKLRYPGFQDSMMVVARGEMTTLSKRKIEEVVKKLLKPIKNREFGIFQCWK